MGEEEEEEGEEGEEHLEEVEVVEEEEELHPQLVEPARLVGGLSPVPPVLFQYRGMGTRHDVLIPHEQTSCYPTVYTSVAVL